MTHHVDEQLQLWTDISLTGGVFQLRTEYFRCVHIYKGVRMLEVEVGGCMCCVELVGGSGVVEEAW